MEVVSTYFLKKKVSACEVLSARAAATSNVSPDKRGFRIGFCLKSRCYESFIWPEKEMEINRVGQDILIYGML